MKPARDPASSRPKPCASLKKPHESCPFAAPCGPRRKKNGRGQTSAFPSETSRFKPVVSRTGVQPSPGSSTIELPSAFAESGAYPPDGALPGSPRQCSLPLACRHPLEGHQTGARKRRTPGNTILSQPYHRRVSTDRLNREGSQLAASLEGEPDPTPAGKTLPHSYPETRFRRERARDVYTSMDQLVADPARGRLNPIAPENLISRDRLGRPVPHQPANSPHSGYNTE